MGDPDARSSSAAQRAQETDSNRKPGFFGRITDALSPSDGGEQQPPTAIATNGAAVTATPVLGMLNLRRMRLEDVAVPKA